MTQRQIQWILAAVTIAALVGVVILLAFGKAVPAELYTFLGVGFGGHLALASPPAPGPAGATSLGLSELDKLIGLLKPEIAPPSSGGATLTAAPSAPTPARPPGLSAPATGA